MMGAREQQGASSVRPIIRFAANLGFLSSLLIGSAQAQGTGTLLGSYDPYGSNKDGKVDCPSLGGFDDVVYALLYQLPSGAFVVDVYRRSDDDMVSILVSSRQSCVFRRLEFHAPAHTHPTPQ